MSANEGLSHQYFFSQEDEGYIADIPNLAMCSAFGRTPAEALAEVETLSRSGWKPRVQSANQFPNQLYRPVIYQLAS